MIRTILICLLVIIIIIIIYNIIHTEPFIQNNPQYKNIKKDININIGVDDYPIYDPLYGYQPIWNAPTRFPSYLYSYPYYYYYPGIYNYYAYSPYWSQWRRWWRW